MPAAVIEWLRDQWRHLTAWLRCHRLRAVAGGRRYKPSEIEAIRQRNRMRL